MIIDNTTTTTMHLEVTIGLNFILSYLYNKLPRRRVNMFGEELEKQMKLKFQGHWYTDKIYKESGYRCLKVNSDTIDLVFVKAAQESGMELQEIVKNLPQYFILWVDPGEVSYRLIDKGPIRILYEDDIRSKIRHKKLENKKDKLSQNKALTYRAHHHHHIETCIQQYYSNNSNSENKSYFLIEDDDTYFDIAVENEECLCYFDFEFTYDNETNNTATPTLLTNGANNCLTPNLPPGLLTNSISTNSISSAISTPSLLTQAFSTNDLQQLQQHKFHAQLGATVSEPPLQAATPTPATNQFNPDAETFKPMLMNSHSSTSLANSKVYKANIFSSTNNLSKTPFNVNLPSLQSSYYPQAQTSQHHHHQQHQQQQQQQSQQQFIHQQLLQQQQLQQKLNAQRAFTTSIDSLNSPMNSMSSHFGGNNSQHGGHHNTSLWSLSSISSPIASSNSSLMISTSTTPAPAVLSSPPGLSNNSNNNTDSNTAAISPIGTSGTPSPSLTNLNVASTLATLKSSTVNANQVFTTATFAQTKFGSTKSKNTNRRPQKMLPSEFSAYIKQKAQIQSLHKSPVSPAVKTPFGPVTATASQNGGHISASISPGLLTTDNSSTAANLAQSLLLDRSFSIPLQDAISPPLRSLSISNSLNAAHDLFNFDASSHNQFDNLNHLLTQQHFHQQQAPIGTSLQDYTSLPNNAKLNNSVGYGACMSSTSSSDSSSVGSSFLSDSISPPSPLVALSMQLPQTTSSTTPHSTIQRKSSFGNFGKMSNQHHHQNNNNNTNNNRFMNNASNLYSSANQANSNVSTSSNSLVAGFANITAAHTNHNNNANNHTNIDVLNNFPYLRSNSIAQTTTTATTTTTSSLNNRNNNSKLQFNYAPDRPNSLFLHLPYDSQHNNSNNISSDSGAYLNEDETTASFIENDDDMPQYFTQYDNVIECELEGNAFDQDYGAFGTINALKITSSLSSSTSSLNKDEATGTGRNGEALDEGESSTSSNSFQNNKLLMAN